MNTEQTAPPYEKLRAIDVSKKIEKKNGLSYLSWAFAVDQLLQSDPAANWTYPQPMTFPDGTVMIYCAVTAFGKTMTAHLPVMDHRNKAIAGPNAFEVNTAMQRCLVKAIALHGIGLYIYAGEDLPAVETEVRGNGHATVNPQLIAAEVDKARRILAKDIDEDAQCLEIFDLHSELSRDPDLYIAVADALAAAKVLSKQQWKDSVAQGKKIAHRMVA